jgi:hypothetical protein
VCGKYERSFIPFTLFPDFLSAGDAVGETGKVTLRCAEGCMYLQRLNVIQYEHATQN